MKGSVLFYKKPSNEPGTILKLSLENEEKREANGKVSEKKGEGPKLRPNISRHHAKRRPQGYLMYPAPVEANPKQM